MSGNAPAGSGMPATAVSASGNAESGNDAGTVGLEQIVNEAINKALGPRIRREFERFEKLLADKTQPTQEQATAAPEAQQGERSSIKQLEQQLMQLKRELETKEKQRSEAERRADDTRLYGDVTQHFARHIGADSPDLEPYVSAHKSSFRIRDGLTFYVKPNEYGEETYVPAKDAVDEMFKTSLKHLVQRNKTPQLPGNANRNAQGRPMTPPTQQQQGRNAIYDTVAQHFASQGAPDAAAAFDAAAAKPKP